MTILSITRATVTAFALATMVTAAAQQDGAAAVNTAREAEETWMERDDSVAAVRVAAEVNQSVATGHNTPFWLVNNRFGIGGVRKGNGYVRAGVFRNAEQTTSDHRFSWGFGVDLVGAWNMTAPFRVQQAYGRVRWRCLDLTVGQKQRYEGFENARLSTGNLLYSTNAMPIPQARLSLPDYVDVPWTNRWMGVKADIAFGAFTDQRWQKSWAAPGSKRSRKVLFHTKSANLRFGREDRFPLTGELRFAMGCQFGGQSIKDGKVTQMGHGLKDWWRALIPMGGDSDVPLGEQTNVYGNHNGAWNLALTWRDRRRGWSVKAYYDHYFEDHSMMMFNNYTWYDGLWGIEGQLPRNPFVSHVVYEYLYTKNQSGPVFWNSKPSHPEQVSGRDDYYNHGIYDGWMNWGMGIGNPLELSPIYNGDHLLYFHHTRLIAHHLGIDGEPADWLAWRLLLTYTRSWGTYDDPTPRVETNFNTLLEVTAAPAHGPLRGWSLTLGLATDGGTMLGPSAGAALTLRRTLTL